MISLVFNSSGLTPLMLTPLDDYFQILGATFHSDENIGEASLSSPQLNIGKDSLPSSPVHPVSSPTLGDATTAGATATVEAQMEEGEIVTMVCRKLQGHLLKDL